MIDELMLLANPDLRSEAMQRAGELRGEGLDASEALSQAWAELKGEDGEDKENFVDDEDDDDDIELYAPLRRNPASGDFGGDYGGLFLMALLGYGFWALMKKSWTPWSGMRIPALSGLSPRQLAGTGQRGQYSAHTGKYESHDSVLLMPLPGNEGSIQVSMT